MNVLHHASLLLLGLLSSACTVAAARAVEVAPAGALVRREVARGFDRYEAALAPYGSWSPDATYGVVWCPRREAAGDGFRPYSNRGHWDFGADAGLRGGQAPPRWVSDDRDTWGEITTHHGWWVRGSGPVGGARGYCWVPGAEETPARVVWRTSDDFVGWAPETPEWLVTDDGDDDLERLDWVYTLVGALVDGASGGDALDGQARDAARWATADAVMPHTKRQHAGPSAATVGAAHQKLVTWALLNPKQLAAAMAKISAANHAGGGASPFASSASSGSGGSSSDAASSTKKSSSSTTSSSGSSTSSVTILGVRFEIVQFPPAMAFYDALLMEPPGVQGFMSSRAALLPNEAPSGSPGDAASALAGTHEGSGGGRGDASSARASGHSARSLLLAGAYGRGSEGAYGHGGAAPSSTSHLSYGSEGSSYHPSSGHTSSHGSSHGSSSSVSFGGGSVHVHR
jgi:hypothetical protein